MPEADDALPGLLRPLAGSTISFVPGMGGIEDAVAALAFASLCGRHDVAIAPEGAIAAGRTTVFGSLAAALGRPGQGGIVLPSRLDDPDALEPALRVELTLLLAEPAALRLAEIAGVPPGRRLPGRDMAHHLDLDSFPTVGAGEGRLRIGLGAIPPGEGDGAAVQLSGADGRWRSPDRCRAAVGDLLATLGRYAEVVTDDGTVATLAGRLGRIVTAARGEAADAVGEPDRELDRLRGLARTARRDAQTAAQALEAARVEVADLRESLDAGVAAAVAAAERGSNGDRLVSASLFDREAGALRERAEAAEGRLAEVEGRLVATMARASTEAEAAARARAEARESSEEIAAGLEAALAGRTDHALALQDALDRAEARLRVAEARITQMQASAEQGRLAHAQLRRITSSLSWRITRPIRVLSRSFVRIAGPRRA